MIVMVAAAAEIVIAPVIVVDIVVNVVLFVLVAVVFVVVAEVVVVDVVVIAGFVITVVAAGSRLPAPSLRHRGWFRTPRCKRHTAARRSHCAVNVFAPKP